MNIRMTSPPNPIAKLRIVWRALKGLDTFLRSQPYLPREIYFDVPIQAKYDHYQDYGVEFLNIPEPAIQVQAGRLGWDPVVYAHDHFVIRTRQGTWDGFGTGQARLSYVVRGQIAPGWLRLCRTIWRPRPRILIK